MLPRVSYLNQAAARSGEFGSPRVPLPGELLSEPDAHDGASLLEQSQLRSTGGNTDGWLFALHHFGIFRFLARFSMVRVVTLNQAVGRASGRAGMAGPINPMGAGKRKNE
ncbi:MAG: hypothetical protein HY236_15500 [Acidobacteria bacterium]|nr:hypothetical protein [Acidobacteriota bacterium]